MRMDIERSSMPTGPWGTELTTRPRYEPTSPMPGAGYGAEPAPAGEWRRYLAVVGRHKWLVLIVTLIGTALGVFGTRFLDRQYGAKAILWVERAGRDRDAERDLISAEVANTMIDAPGWVQVVTSNAVLDSVVRRLRLYLTPSVPEDAPILASLEPGENVIPGVYRLVVDGSGRTFELNREDGTVVEKGAVGDSVGSAVGFAWAPAASALTPGKRIEFQINSPYEAAQSLARQLNVRMDIGSTFLVIQLKGKDPARITQAVNAVAVRTVAVAAEMKRRRFQDLATILGEQYEHARRTLDTAENNLRAYRIRTAGALGARTYANAPRVDNAIYELSAAAEQLRRDREALDAVVRAGGPGTVEAMASIPAARESPQLALAMAEITRKQAQLRELRTRYTDEAAPVAQLQAELDSLTRTAVPTIAGEVSGNLAARERVMRPRAAAAAIAVRRIPTLELDDSRLAREVSNAEELSNAVRQRFEAVRLALVSSLPDVRILDGAVVPHRPAVSLAPIMIALAFLTSLALAVVGVIVREGTDTKVRTPEQVTRGMRLQILGAIPHVGSRTFGGDAAAPVIEALRALRLRVLHSHSNGNGPLMLTVTSPAMGEGKSFVSSNLALSFADAGYRTLLVDGDLRRGAQHIVMGTDMRPGFTDVLAGTLGMKDAIKETANAGLAFLSAGTRMHRAPELLLSQRLKDSVEEVKNLYDVIIVDSPPLAAGVDTIVLGTVTRNMMLVLRSGRSELELAAAKLDGMDTLPVRIIGAVLNDVRDGGAFRHYTYEDYVQSIGGTATTGRDGPRILQGANSDD